MSERQEDTRARLLDATLRVVAERGVAGATSREITAAAGANLQAITYHFGSKDVLVAQALVGAVRRWVAPALAALDGVGSDPVGRLVAAVLALQSAMRDARDHVPAYVEALAVAQRDETVRAELVALLDGLRAGLAAAVTELKDAGVIADWVDPAAMAALLVAAGDGVVLHTTLEPDGYPVEAALGQLAQLLLAARVPPPQ